MTQIQLLIQILEHIRNRGMKTIEIIEKEGAWEYRVTSKEYTIRETFYHVIKSIFEDAGNWFLNDKKKV